MHWHLDVTFRGGANTTLDKQAAQNQKIIRKLILNCLFKCIHAFVVEKQPFILFYKLI